MFRRAFEGLSVLVVLASLAWIFNASTSEAWRPLDAVEMAAVSGGAQEPPCYDRYYHDCALPPGNCDSGEPQCEPVNGRMLCSLRGLWRGFQDDQHPVYSQWFSCEDRGGPGYVQCMEPQQRYCYWTTKCVDACQHDILKDEWHCYLNGSANAPEGQHTNQDVDFESTRCRQGS